MTTPAAGWYPDPASPENVRWWDGAAWTQHVQPNPQLAPTAPTAAPVVAEVPATATTQVLDPAADVDSVVTGGDIVPQSAGAGSGHVLSAAEVIAASQTTAGDTLTAATTVEPSEAEGKRSLDLRGIDISDVPKHILIGAGAVLVGVVSLFLPWMTSSMGSSGAFSALLPWLLTGGDLTTGTSGIIGHGVLYVLLFGIAAAGLSGKLPRGKVVTMAVGGVVTVLTALNYMQFSGNTGDIAGPGSALAIGFGVYTMLVAGIGIVVAGLLTDDS